MQLKAQALGLALFLWGDSSWKLHFLGYQQKNGKIYLGKLNKRRRLQHANHFK
jgi:hypothetical protein